MARRTQPVTKRPLTRKQKLMLLLFFLEILFYPFIVGVEKVGGASGTVDAGRNDLKHAVISTWLGAMFLWVPIAFMIGLIAGRRLKNHSGLIRFFHEKKVSPDEIPPIVGILAPLVVVTIVVLIYATVICMKLFFITIPIYLIIRFWKKKGIRSFLRWTFRGVGGLAIRLKRLSYIGYILPILFGFIFAKWLSRGMKEPAAASYVLILLQMIVLVALWKHIRIGDIYRAAESVPFPPSPQPALSAGIDYPSPGPQMREGMRYPGLPPYQNNGQQAWAPNISQPYPPQNVNDKEFRKKRRKGRK